MGGKKQLRGQRSAPTPQHLRRPAPVAAASAVAVGHRRREILLYLALALFAFAMRGLYLVELSGSLPFSVLVVDSRVYDDWAQEIASGNWLGDEVFYQAPLYPYFMGSIYRIFGYDPMYVRWVQAILGASACVLVAFAGRAFISRLVGLAAGVLLAIYPPALFFDGLLQKSSLDLFLMALFLAAAGQFLRKPRNTWALAAGISLGAFILNRENGRLLYPIVIGWICLYFQQLTRVQRAVASCVLTAGILLILLPVGWRNYHVGGEFLLSTSQFGPNFYIGNNPAATGLYVPLIEGRGHTIYERADAVQLAEQAAGHELTPSEVSDYWRDLAFDFIRTEPVAWIRLMLWKSYLVFHSVELVDSEGIEVYASYSWLLWGLSWFSFGLLVPLALLGIWITRSEWRRLALLYVSLLTLAASVALFFVFARYRYPMVPIMMIFSGASVCAALDWIRQPPRQFAWSAWGVPLAIVLLLTVILNWPLPQYRDDAIAYANYGKELLEAGDYPRALEALERSIELQPAYAGARHNLGVTLQALRQPQAAAEQFQMAIRLDPDHAPANWFLGRCLLAEGRANEAIAHLRTATAHLPEESLIRLDLARGLLQLGNPRGAEQELTLAVQLAPDSALAVNNLAWLLATSPDEQVRDGARAVTIAQPLRELADPQMLDTVAAAYAEAGSWDEALSTIHRAVELAEQAGNQPLATELQGRLQQYEQHRPHRDVVNGL